MKRKLKALHFAAAFAAALGSSGPLAATVGGVTLEPRVRPGGQPLALVSCGVRDTLWIDVYAAGLYIPPGQDAVAAADDDVPKAVRLKVIEARYLPEEIPDKWRGVLAEELRREPMSRVRAAYGNLARGDVVTFHYQPGKGTTMRLNGERIVKVDGHRIVDAILREWSEGDPITGKLHRLKLDHPC